MGSNQIRKTIREQISKLLAEVRVLNPDFRSLQNELPIKDSDTIRVYHGFHNLHDAIMAAKFGISGKERARRRYSYESNNNPFGLFVTLDFNKAKDFAYPSGGHKIVFEIHVKASNLEAPVWPSGSYTVQGQMAQFWTDDEERYQQGTLKAREKASNDKLDFVSKSDRPELAYSLLYSENQALFTGDLNPNMIHAIWYAKSEKGHGFNPVQLQKMSVKQFLNQFDEHEPSLDSRGHMTQKGREYSDKVGRVFKPNDDFDEDQLIQGLINKGWADNEKQAKEDVIDDVIKKDDHYSNLVMWPKQIQQAKEQGFFDN